MLRMELDARPGPICIFCGNRKESREDCIVGRRRHRYQWMSVRNMFVAGDEGVENDTANESAAAGM